MSNARVSKADGSQSRNHACTCAGAGEWACSGGSERTGVWKAVAFAKETHCFIRYERSLFRPLLPKTA